MTPSPQQEVLIVLCHLRRMRSWNPRYSPWVWENRQRTEYVLDLLVSRGLAEKKDNSYRPSAAVNED